MPSDYKRKYDRAGTPLRSEKGMNRQVRRPGVFKNNGALFPLSSPGGEETLPSAVSLLGFQQLFIRYRAAKRFRKAIAVRNTCAWNRRG